MWIYTTDSHLSIVAHRDRPGMLLVRSRVAGDLERAFGPVISVEHTPSADYAWRTVLSRDEVAEVLADGIRGIRYTNFKDAANTPERHRHYLNVWAAYSRATSHLRRVQGLGPDPELDEY